MSQNRSSNENTLSDGGRTSTTGAAGGGASTGATDAGTTRDTSTSMTTGGGAGATGTPASGAGTGTATGRAQDYRQKVTDAAVQARDYVTDKASVVGDKFKELQNKDFSQVADDAKEYARQKPGQALLISAAAGFVIGLLLRGGRR